ncbi:MAG: galactitol-1-phosphate 5-dehydrogenase [Trueperaceae bacterium]
MKRESGNMRALVWEGPREMNLRELPVVQPGPDEVLLRVDAVGICGSELSGYLGHNSLRKPPLVMGHEFSGTIEAAGEMVESPAVGERVVVNPLLFCGTCSACRRGRFNLCSNRALVGAHRPGAFAEKVIVPAVACQPVPAGMAPAIASLAEPVACAVRAVRLARVGLGDELLVLGAGPIGLLSARLAQEAGAAVSITDTNASRLAIAKRWGVERTIEADQSGGSSSLDPAALRASAPGEGFDAAIDAVGLAATRKQAIESVRRGGTVVFVGLHGPEVSFDANEVVRNETVIRGSFAYTPHDFETACSFLARGDLPPSESWLSLRSLDEGPESFRELVDGQPEVLKIVLQP